MKKIFNIIEILSDLKDLEKKIYLDSPEVFVDFADRISENNLDEIDQVTDLIIKKIRLLNFKLYNADFSHVSSMMDYTFYCHMLIII